MTVKIIPGGDRAAVEKLLARRGRRGRQAEAAVKPILEAVRQRGDRALLAYARRWDGLRGETVAVPAAALSRAAAELPRPFRSAVELASGHIWEFCHLQMPRSWRKRVRPGLSVGQMVRPLDSVAAYVPGGRYPLPSTLMMTVIPAQVAGVKTISVACPSPNPVVLGTAALLGVKNFYRMGGAQAVAAFAYGTETVPRARRIVGPGNIYVAAAKRLLAGEVGIDFVAGPSEILIIAGDGDPRLSAADMLAQAEHDADASAVLLTSSMKTALAVSGEIERQLETLPPGPWPGAPCARTAPSW